MTACPSGRYLTEIRTASGLTVERPTTSEEALVWDWSGSEQDYADWDVLAISLISRLERAWVYYKSFPGTATAPVAEYNNLVDQLNSVRERYAKMRRPWTTDSSAFGTTGYTWGITLPEVSWDTSDEIDGMVSLIVDAQCLRQRLDESLTRMGGNPDGPPDINKKSPNTMPLLGKIGYVAAVGGLAYVGYLGIGYLAARKSRQ